LKKAILRTEEEWADDVRCEEAQHEAVERAGEFAAALTPDQRELLNRLTAWAEDHKYRVDAKASAILAWIETHLKTDGEWNGKRVILFTEYRATHSWLHQILTAQGYGGERLTYLHGSMDPEEREAVKAAFQSHPDVSPVRILLATDAASEGIDLQNHCNYMIHVEIPWNPNVMEQRNGRIDRHGQKEPEVHIWHPVGKGFDMSAETPFAKMGDVSGDHEYLMRAVLKINAIREDLGSVGPVIAKQIEEAMLGRRDRIDTTDAETRASRARRFVAAEKKLQERIARLHEKLVEAKSDFHLSSDHIYQAVRTALELAEKPSLMPRSIAGVPDGKVFDVPVLPGSWGRATSGLEHPHTKVRRPITFDHDIAKGRDDIVLAHLNHRLVQMCLRLLREELWKLDDLKKLHRVTVRAVPDSEIQDIAVSVWSRLVIIGGSHHRLHEELTLSGGELKDGNFSRVAQIGKLEALIEKSVPAKPGDGLFDIMRERFSRFESPVLAAVEARSRERLKYLENTLLRRKESEITDLNTVLDDLEKGILKEFENEGHEELQLSLWPEEERSQLRRDIEALRTRLARIPDERKNETEMIESRYSNPVDRTFPVAVVFLVPQSMLSGK